ncbi:MAG: hypothetical protein IJ192_00670 [Clostridia bacterium]|nr:hypothetical protein [Clostridia bacterium]
MIYAAEEDYRKFYQNVPESFEQLVRRASRNIDILTYCRINGIGWDNLTDFQRDTITEACCDMVQFMSENGDLLDTPLNSYSINGVSMQFQFNPTVYCSKGVIMRQNTYSMLMSTGLCYGGLR